MALDGLQEGENILSLLELLSAPLDIGGMN